MGPIPLDVPPSNELRLIANAVDELEPGAYRFEPPDGFELLRRGDFRRQAGYLVLEQFLGALAAALMFAVVDLDAVLERHGNRGYRAAQLEAGIRVGRIYLGAFARGLGATASTFYDDDVTAFLAPDEGLSPMLCAAVGRRSTTMRR
jgi:Nitroreductase family